MDYNCNFSLRLNVFQIKGDEQHKRNRLYFTWALGLKTFTIKKGFPGGASSKEATCQCRRQETQVSFPGWEDPLEEGMATHSNILAWGIPWMEEPGGLQSMGLQRVRHN